MGTCKLCHAEAALVKSHVIPHAFFRSRRGDPAGGFLISEKHHPKKAPQGVYDNSLLCAGCEGAFLKVDTYGSEVLIGKRAELFKLVTSGNAYGEIESRKGSIDQDLLLRFFVSVLWRASASTQGYFDRIKLGQYAAQAASVIQPGIPVPNSFAVVLSCWGNDAQMPVDLARVNMDPFQEKWEGVNAYRFYFGDVVAYIKVDQRPFPPRMQRLALGHADHVVMVSRNFQKSSDFEAMRTTARVSRLPASKLFPA